MNAWQTSLYMSLQRSLPQHLLSRFAGWLADRRSPWVKHPFIQLFMSAYNISLQEAEREDCKEFIDFNDFFTRTLKPSARPLATGPGHLISPVDGSMNTHGQLDAQTLLQAKGHSFTLDALLTDAEMSKVFADGSYASIYLAPHNYHRVHAPLTGELTHMIYVPGKLFAVNPTTMQHLPNVIARNERVISIFNTEHGPMAMIMVGAMIVGSIHTAWAGRLPNATAPGTSQTHGIQRWDYAPGQITLNAGDDMGQFRLGGSMVVLLLSEPAAQAHWQWQPHLATGQAVKMGELIGNLQHG